MIMKTPSKPTSEVSDDLRPEYRFDYSRARPNPYAARLKGRPVAVVLDPEVAEAFPTSESVNSALRSVMATNPRRSSTRKAMRGSRQSDNGLQPTRSAKARRRGPRR